MKARLTLMCALAGTLAACATAQEKQAAAQQQAAAIDAKCQGYGFTPGTEAMAKCRMQLELATEQANQRRREEIGDAIEQAGQAFKPPPPVHCTTTMIGNMANTNCY
jgi:hypothetical protein